MLWGSFGLVHIITLALAAAITVGLYFALKYMPERARFWAMLVMSLSGIVAVVYNLVAWGSPLEYLPLHMCSISAILLPLAVLTRNKYIGNLLLIWCLGSLLALVFNQAQAEYEIPSAAFFIYYIPHVLEFAVMLYLFKFKYVKKDYRTIPPPLASPSASTPSSTSSISPSISTTSTTTSRICTATSWSPTICFP